MKVNISVSKKATINYDSEQIQLGLSDVDVSESGMEARFRELHAILSRVIDELLLKDRFHE